MYILDVSVSEAHTWSLSQKDILTWCSLVVLSILQRHGVIPSNHYYHARLVCFADDDRCCVSVFVVLSKGAVAGKFGVLYGFYFNFSEYS